MAKANGKKPKTEKTPQGITHITVGGYKSIAREQTIEIRPLTILAGANSSGKSSIMQPLLLLKQTLEAPYDPGALLLNGPNVKLTAVEQLMTRSVKGEHHARLTIGIRSEADDLRLEFGRDVYGELEVQRQYTRVGDQITELPRLANPEEKETRRYSGRQRCFLTLVRTTAPFVPDSAAFETPGACFILRIEQVIHLPGLRGAPERSYPRAAVASSFPGTFESYFASVLSNWAREGLVAELGSLDEDLSHLGLTWKIQAKANGVTQVELNVARLPRRTRGGAHDLVNIADVGFGVSQTLPVVVALLAAEPGQLVYLEQPEIHLHPRAQVAMAQILANAAMRGVKVVAETHSSLLLLGVQSLVAEGKLPRDKVILHWFERNDEGATDIRMAELDEQGRFGDWPQDFDDVTLNAQWRYLNAAETRRAAR